MIKLKPCPVCGEDPHVDVGEITGYGGLYIEFWCATCGYPKKASGDTVYSKNINKAREKAAKDWNKEVNKIEGFLAQKGGPVKR